MMNNTPSGAKKHRESTKPEKVTRPPNVSLSSSSDGLVQICVTLSRWFSHKTAAFFTEQCTSSSLSSRFEVTRGDSDLLTEKLWLPLWRHFFFTCTHAHKSLSNETLLLRKIAELEVFEESLWFFSQYYIGRSSWKETSSVLQMQKEMKRSHNLCRQYIYQILDQYWKLRPGNEA